MNSTTLRINRQANVIDSFRKAIRKTFKTAKLLGLNYEKTLKLLMLDFEQIEEDASNIKLQFILLRQFIIEKTANFEAIITPYFKAKQKDIIILAFKHYKNMQKSLNSNKIHLKSLQ